jgi:hypothetical protein
LLVNENSKNSDSAAPAAAMKLLDEKGLMRVG